MDAIGPFGLKRIKHEMKEDVDSEDQEHGSWRMRKKGQGPA